MPIPPTGHALMAVDHTTVITDHSDVARPGDRLLLQQPHPDDTRPDEPDTWIAWHNSQSDHTYVGPASQMTHTDEYIGHIVAVLRSGPDLDLTPAPEPDDLSHGL